MGWKKRLVFLLILAGLAQAQGYKDIPPGHWAEEAIRSLTEKGVIIGFPDGTFRGNEAVTRYQAAILLYRLLSAMTAEIQKALAARPEVSPEAVPDPKLLETLVQAISGLSSTLADLTLRVSALEAARGQAPSLLDPELANALAALKGDVASLKNTVQAADHKLVEWQALLEAMAARMDELRSLLDQRAREGEKVAEDTALALRMTTELYREVSQARDAYRALAQEVASLRQELKALASRPLVDEEARKQAAALKEAQASLALRLDALEGRVKTLEASQVAVDWAAAGLLLLGSGVPVDLDRLFPKALDGRTDRPDTLPRGQASARLVLSRPGGERYSLELGGSAGSLGVRPSLAASYEKGGFSFRAAYSGYLDFRFHPYLLANRDPLGTLGREGVFLEVRSGEASLALAHGQALRGSDPNPALQGTFTALRLGYGPLGLVYGEDASRRVLGAEAGAGFGGFGLTAAWAGSTGGSLSSLFSPAAADWAYHVRSTLDLGNLKASLAYFAVDPDYQDGQAGLSQDADRDVYPDTPTASYPYAPGYRGFALSLEGSYLGLGLAARGLSQADYNGTAGSYGTAFTASLTVPLGSLRLSPFYGSAWGSGDGYLDTRTPAPYLAGAYRHQDPLRAYASAYGLHLGLGGGEDRFALGLTATYHPVEKALEGSLQARYTLDASPFSLTALFLADHNRAAGTEAGSSTFLGGEARAALDLGPLSLSLRGAYGERSYTGDGTSLTAPAASREARFSLEAAYALDAATRLRAGYGFLAAARVAPEAFSRALSDAAFPSLASDLPPWAVLPGGAFFRIQAYYLGLSLGSVEATYYLLDTSQGEGRAFRLRYSLPAK